MPLSSSFKEETNDSIELASCQKASSGLETHSGKKLPLKSVHVRARLLDLIAKVTIYQEYENDEDTPIEAKYLFPLNDTATVCGFEAFIGDKHIIGVCKEKEQAHTEYREAVEAGQGAYLIDQETQELFRVNIGNLPPKCRCIIKITYVTELDVHNEEIHFKLPNSLSAWQMINPSKQVLQESVISTFINKLTDKHTFKTTSFVASVQMPFEIISVKSPTHRLNIKKTACQAVCELGDIAKTNGDDDSLILIVNIATIHMPRMLVEDFRDEATGTVSRACMVSFYPEFEINRTARYIFMCGLIF